MKLWKIALLLIWLSLIGFWYYISSWLVFWFSNEWDSDQYSWPTLERTERTHKLQQAVIELGYTEYQSKLFIDICKKQEKNISARYCVYWISAVWVAESNACKLDHWYNCWWIMRQWMIVEFENRPQAVEYWVEGYYRYWRTNKTSKDWIVRSRYCVSDSHWSNEPWCPNWIINTSWVMEHFESKNIY